jgi:ubiquinone biosynthesis protein Coq4
LIARLDVARRVPPVKASANDTWGEQALSSTWDLMRGAGRGVEDPEMAWRYKRLGLLPRGTLGRTYWSYMTSNRFFLPGERGAAAGGTTYHDFVHALSGYDTSEAGEAEITAFTAGMLKMDDPVAMILGTMSMLLLGSKLRPGSPAPVLRLEYDRIGRALSRGLRATAELAERWDPWSVVGEPVDALAARYGIQAE